MQKIKRIYHTWDKWECYPAGFYENAMPGKTKDQCEEEYREFLADLPRFKKALARVISEWNNSCEHYLTNEKMNRIAWLGQAAMCIETGMPSCFRSGYFLLNKDQQSSADLVALDALNNWLDARGFERVDLGRAGVSAQANIY